MNINEKNFDEDKSLIIRRLQAATQNKEIQEKMLAEDTVLSEIQELEQALDKAAALKKATPNLEKTSLELENERKQKEELENRFAGAVKNLASQGFDMAKIAQILGISEGSIK